MHTRILTLNPPLPYCQNPPSKIWKFKTQNLKTFGPRFENLKTLVLRFQNFWKISKPRAEREKIFEGKNAKFSAAGENFRGKSVENRDFLLKNAPQARKFLGYFWEILKNLKTLNTTFLKIRKI